MTSRGEIVEDLVVALLAVSAYPLERVADILPSLRSSRLTDPAFVASADEGEVTRLLNASGYKRGLLVGMYAERLHALMRHIAGGGLEGIEQAVTAKDRAAIEALLKGVRGVGPKVLENAAVLLFSQR